MSIKLARKEKGVEYLSRALENGAVKAPRLGSAFRIKIFAEGAHFTRKIQKNSHPITEDHPGIRKKNPLSGIMMFPAFGGDPADEAFGIKIFLCSSWEDQKFLPFDGEPKVIHAKQQQVRRVTRKSGR